MIAIAHHGMKSEFTPPALFEPRLPVRERAIGPPMGRPRGSFCHRLDERELLFVDAHAKAGPVVGPHLTVLAVEELGMYGTERSPWLYFIARVG